MKRGGSRGQHLAKKALGHHQAIEKAEARRAAKHTLGAVITDYLDACQARLRPSTMEHLRRYLRDWWKPLHAMPIHKLTRRDIAAHLSGPPVAAARARSRLMAACRWAIEQGYILGHNMCLGTGIPDRHVMPRERVLSLDEIAAIWKACNGPYAYDTIIRLLIVTACRRQEIGSLRWCELDRQNGLLVIPAARAKNKRDHVPSPPLAWGLIEDWQARGAFPDHLFSGKGFKAWATNKSALDARCGVIGWTLHDIRRSVATHMADAGVSPHVIERILGHELGSRIAKTYNKSIYLNETRTALAMWADRIEALVEGGRKIILFHQ